MRRLKVIIISVLLLTSSISSATKYYVSSTSGNDGADGKTQSTSWKTISKVNGKTFLPGDSILFMCGDVWRETLNVPSSGTSDSYIYFGSYKTGKKPKILGSTQAISWTNIGGNIWKSGTSVINPYGMVGSEAEIFFEELNGSVTWGTHQINTTALTAEYHWTWASNFVYVYAITDPGIRYASVEVPQRDEVINIGNTHEYITIDGFDLKYSKVKNITDDDPETSLSGFTLKNCLLSYVGSRIKVVGYNCGVCRNNMLIQNNEIHNGGRRSISIHVYDANNLTFSNITIEGNICHDGYHGGGVGIAMDGSRSNNRFENIIIRNNLFYDPPTRNPLVDGFDKSAFVSNRAGETGSSIANVKIYNNIFRYPTYLCVELYNVDNAKVYNNTFYDFNPNASALGYILHIDISNGCTGIDIKNNIFYGTTTKTIVPCNSIFIESTQPVSAITFDYNLFYEKDPSMSMVNIGSSIYYRTTGTKPWSALKTDLGWQIHEPGLVDPLFVSTTDNHLKKNSVAIGAGINLGLLTDYENNDYNDPPSIGAYEGNPPDIPVPPVKPQGQQMIIVYPNPSDGNLTIQREGSNLETQDFMIISMSGKIMVKGTLEEGAKTKQVPLHLDGGIYIVQVSLRNQTTAAEKFIVINAK